MKNTSAISHNIKRYSIATLVAILFGACSGDGRFTDETIQLVIGESVEVSQGDTLSPVNSETKIKVEHIIGSEKKTVTLLEGEATLVYGNYTVEETK